mmetsp:Transcript_5314/g.10528  ORF Transcript_5314/g.10528 Transcript_5314/m.10528 type:complete len:206 (+) Transcript_5314:1282-1899(+)
MEEPVVENLSERALHKGVDKLRLIKTQSLQSSAVRQSESLDPFHHQDLFGCEGFVDNGCSDVLRREGVDLIELLRVVGFKKIVYLPVDESPKVINHGDEVQVTAHGLQKARKHLRVRPEDEQINPDLLFTAWPLNFHRHLLPVASEPPFVHLPDGSCRHRLAVDFGKDLVNCHSEFFLDCCKGLWCREGWQSVLKLLQLFKVLSR